MNTGNPQASAFGKAPTEDVHGNTSWEQVAAVAAATAQAVPVSTFQSQVKLRTWCFVAARVLQGRLAAWTRTYCLASVLIKYF